MSIGLVQLEKKEKKIKHCKRIYSLYKKCIERLDFIDLIEVDLSNEIPLYIEVISDIRTNLIKYLKENKIDISYLPPSLHLSKHILTEPETFFNSKYFNGNSFILPCGPNQKIKNVKYVIKILQQFKVKNEK